MKTVTLVSSDDREVTVRAKIARMSGTVCRLMEVYGENDDCDQLLVPLPTVTCETLERVVEWCTQHRRDASTFEPDEKTRANYQLSKWDGRFFERIANTDLFELVMAANYLEVVGLLEASCNFVAGMFKGWSRRTIIERFGVSNDLTISEKEQIDNETAWITQPRSHDTTPSCAKFLKFWPPDKPATSSHFPLLELPNEILAIILQHMNLADRLIARVNKRLYQLEQHGRFWVNDIAFITENDCSAYPVIPARFVTILLNAGCVSILRKLANNVSVGTLTVWIQNDDPFRRQGIFDKNQALLTELFPYITRISVRDLSIGAFVVNRDEDVVDDDRPSRALQLELHDSNIVEWSNGRDSVDVRHLRSAITGRGLFLVYEAMVSKTSSMRRYGSVADERMNSKLLRLIGIDYGDRFQTRRRDVRVFANGPRFYNDPLFPDRYEIGSTQYCVIISNEMHTMVIYTGRGYVCLERHNDDGSLPSLPCFEKSQSVGDIVSNKTAYKAL